MVRKKHQSRSVEVHVRAPRLDAWAAIDELMASTIRPMAELSVEPPWRRCYEADTSALPLDFYQATFLIRDDGPECHVAWGIVFDPEPTDAGLAAVAQEQAAMQAILDEVAHKFDLA